MPDRPVRQTVEGILSDHATRLRAVERLASQLQPFLGEVDVDSLIAYSWQSALNLTAGLGHRLYADRAGIIQFIRAERSAADGTSTATFDVLHNGTTLFGNNAKPEVAAGQGLGPERQPDTVVFQKGDWFQVEIEDTGGGTGPLRVTIHFVGT